MKKVIIFLMLAVSIFALGDAGRILLNNKKTVDKIKGLKTEIAALDTVEVMSTQYRVPILVKSGDNLKTEDLRFTDLSKYTCKTCDVVILNNGILTKSSNVTDDRDSVRSVFVYNGGRLIVPDNLDFHVHDLK